MKKTIFLLLVVFYHAHSRQKEKITLEDIWSKGTFSSAPAIGEINWDNNGTTFTRLEKGSVIKRFEAASGKNTGVVLNLVGLVASGADSSLLSLSKYSFSGDNRKILLETDPKPVYRRSYSARYWVCDIVNGHLQEINKGIACRNATMSPDGKSVSFIYQNNLFVQSLSNDQVRQITRDGNKNHLINGHTDWVYEEEFEFSQAYFWSPDSKYLAYYKFDESTVPEYNMQVWKGLYPADYRYKYPKAGESNANVSLWMCALSNDSSFLIRDLPETNGYFPRAQWTAKPGVFSYLWMNRSQNKLEVHHYNLHFHTDQPIYTEVSDTYVEINDDMQYLADGKTWAMTSEKDGYRHIYLFDYKGKQLSAVTKGKWEVVSIAAIDEPNQKIYYLSKETSPLEKQLYVADFEGNIRNKLSKEPGTHDIGMSPGCLYYTDRFSAIQMPPSTGLYNGKGTLVRKLGNNQQLEEKLKEYETGKISFFTIPDSAGTLLNGWMLKPENFDSGKKYPVLMYVYGGPGAQDAVDRWGGTNLLWYYMLASKGYIVVCVDNKGTGGRGVAFKKCTYSNLGGIEVRDQITAARYLGNLPYIDKNRIGIWGWSFGGYLSSLCVLLGNDVFKMAIAVAPVTHWKFYDTIYTERYLKTPRDNTAGYEKNSPLNYADRLKGKYLLVHGTGDDNVHFQHAITMQEALIQSGKMFTSMFYPNKNHSIGGASTRLHLYTTMTRFIEENL